MEKNILPEISNWRMDSPGLVSHFLRNTKEVKNILKIWIKKHENYYIHEFGERNLIIYKKE